MTINNQPIENSSFSGFYEIPGFSLYVISKDGKVLNKISGNFLSGSINPAGYHNYRLLGDNGKTLTWGLHRLLGFVFKNPGLDITDLVVNHLDGNKANNKLGNLEWTTHLGNLIHAGINKLTNKCQSVMVRCAITGEIKHFVSIVDCARFYNVSKDFINWRVKSTPGKVFPEKKQYKLFSDPTPWFIPENLELELLKNSTSKPIMMKNVITKEIMFFDKIADAALYLDVTASSITKWLSQPNQPVLPKFVQLKSAYDTTPWREVSDPYLELSQYTNKRCVKIINDFTKEEKIFSSCLDCSQHLCITATTLNYRLKSNGNIVYEGYRYMYYSN
jgi:hypothetical protein